MRQQDEHSAGEFSARHTIAMVSENRANIISRLELSKARSSSIQSCCTNKHTLIGMRSIPDLKQKQKTVFTMFKKTDPRHNSKGSFLANVTSLHRALWKFVR